MRKGQAILALLSDKPVAYHPDVARIVGGVKAAVFLCQLLFWTGREARPDGFIWKTQKEMEKETALTRSEQEGARKKLRALGILEEMRAGIPAKLHYRLDTDKFLQLVDAFYSRQDCGKPANCTDENLQTITESTTENTTDLFGASAPITDDDQPQETVAPDSVAEKRPARKRRQSKRVNGGKQEGLPGIPTCEIETPQERLLFDLLGVQFRAKGRRRPTKFPTLAVKERFAAAATSLDGNLESAIGQAFAAGITSVPKVVGYVAAIAESKERDAATAEGRVYTSQEGVRVIEL